MSRAAVMGDQREQERAEAEFTALGGYFVQQDSGGVTTDPNSLRSICEEPIIQLQSVVIPGY